MNKLNFYRLLIPTAYAVWGSGNRKAACDGGKELSRSTPTKSNQRPLPVIPEINVLPRGKILIHSLPKTLVSLQACSLVSPPKV